MKESNYKKIGRKERQEELYPQLLKEIEQKRKDLLQGILYQDQDSQEYKTKLSEEGKKLIHEGLKPRQKMGIINRILLTFSTCFWLPGCHAPRVEGFVAKIHPVPDAVGRCQQPFRLSEYDQARLELAEDIEVAEGKAVWAEPGQAFTFCSPSFVVDQDGKGLLGRCVRDYRFMNSQTCDTAWPAADAELCLSRAQAGWFHSSLDCVWGFTQLPVDEETSKLLALVTRRGILLPKVLFFGPNKVLEFFSRS